MSAAGDVLRRAKERISRYEWWLKGHLARVPGYLPSVASIKDPDACLCADGALLAAAGGKPLPVGTSLCLSLAARARGFETASRFNDAPETTHEDVMDLFDDAARRADAS